MNQQEQLRTIFEDLFGLPDLTGEESMDSVPEWDSVMHVTLLLTLEQEFGVTISPEEAGELTTISRIREFLATRSGESRAA